MNVNISSTAVKLAALLLIEINESTTTLDVKNLLRDNNVHATQDQVSDLMEQAANELPLDFTTNGVYRTYTLPDPQTVASNIPATPQQMASPSTKPSVNVKYTMKSGKVIGGTRDSDWLEDGDWIVTHSDSTSDDDTIYFSQTFTRDEVRQAYSKITGQDFWNVRARKH